MNITTYYSFKGGVGRTMALVNVGFELARRGRNVLLVDFDLEAPGITTYRQFSHAAVAPGVVDYVSQYLETHEAPEVRDYIVPCSAVVEEKNLPIWLMPAGRRDEKYAANLAAIDWQGLYRDHSGYLMFEDLKQQWDAFQPKFDYVLIDSRTGHTDVGGICTRQLPHAVVLMYFPNEQNISGLEMVAEEIRREEVTLNKPTKLLFCPSNVPNLDDEYEILKTQCDRAQVALRYKQPAAIIHRYDSLALLDQTVFVLERPKTRLSEEYRTLTLTVVRGNPEDREGALAELDDIRQQLRLRTQGPRKDLDEADRSQPPFLARISKQLSDIRIFHPRDGEIALALAKIFQILGDLSGELEALNVAIEQNYRVEQARYLRALCLLGQQRPKEAAADLKAVLASEESTAIAVVGAVKLLRTVEPAGWLSLVRSSSTIQRLDPEDQLKIAHILALEVEGLDLASEITGRILASTSYKRTHASAKKELVLSLIGAGRFAEAIQVIAPSRSQILTSRSIEDIFNYAMAEWGLTGTPPKDVLERTVELAAEAVRYRGANFAECLSLTNAILGNKEEATNFLARAREVLGTGNEFSCWRYLPADRQQMDEDLDALERMIAGGLDRPSFLKRGRSMSALH
jgi:tetratricopeptide (TPR) repeat protein